MTKKCWAKSLGNCSGISGEHVISRGVLEQSGKSKLSIAGNQRVPDGDHSIGSLTANILCAKHNSALGQLDDEATKLASFLVKHTAGAESSTVTIDGPKLERWAIKTAVNSLAAGWSDSEKWLPSHEVVESVFGFRPIFTGHGLYFIETGLIHRQSRLNLRCANIFATFENSPKAIAGVFIDINSLRLFVSFIHDAPTNFKRLMKDSKYTDQIFVHRPYELLLQRDEFEPASIKLTWPYLYM